MKLKSQDLTPREIETKEKREATKLPSGSYRSRRKTVKERPPTAMQMRRNKIIKGVTWVLVIAFASTCVAFISGRGRKAPIDQPSRPAASQTMPADEKKREIEFALEDVKQRPNDPTSHYNLAVRYQAANYMEKAISHFQKAIELDPKHTAAMYHLGQIYLEQKKTDSCIDILNKLIKIDQKDSEAHLLLGGAYMLKNDPVRARKEVDISISLDPGNPLAYLRRAELQMANAEIKEAHADLQTALEIARAQNNAALLDKIQNELNKIKKK